MNNIPRIHFCDKTLKLFWAKPENIEDRSSWRLPTLEEAQSLYTKFTNCYEHSIFKIDNFVVYTSDSESLYRGFPPDGAEEEVTIHYYFDFHRGKPLSNEDLHGFNNQRGKYYRTIVDLMVKKG